MRGDPILSHCVCGAEVSRPPEGERPEPMRHEPSCPFQHGPKCEWCTGPMYPRNPRARCCSKKCKAALWKHEHGYGHQKRRKQCSYTKSSGLQVSYLKLVTDIPDEPMSKSELEEWITSKLSTRQREQLAQRSNERRAA